MGGGEVGGGTLLDAGHLFEEVVFERAEVAEVFAEFGEAGVGIVFDERRFFGEHLRGRRRSLWCGT